MTNEADSDGTWNSAIQSNILLKPRILCKAGHPITHACSGEHCQNSLRCDDLNCQFCGLKVHNNGCLSIPLSQLTEGINRRVNSYKSYIEHIAAIDQKLIHSIKNSHQILAEEFQQGKFEPYDEEIIDRIYKDHSLIAVSGKEMQEFCRRLFERINCDHQKNEQVIRQYETHLKRIVTDIIKSKQLLLRSFNNSIYLDSSILNKQEWIDRQNDKIFLFDTLNRPVKFELLFRGSRDGFSAKTFHQLCDNIENTLVLLKTEFGKVIGGFTKYKWNQVLNKHVTDKNREAFIFSLDLKQKFTPNLKGEHLIYCCNDYGPTFGNGCDLQIVDECNINKKSYANFPYSYNCYNDDDLTPYLNCQKSYTMFSGATKGNNFRVEDYEVFQVFFK